MIFAVLVHAANAVLHNHGNFEGKSRIVALTRRDDARKNLAMSIVMLQTFA